MFKVGSVFIPVTDLEYAAKWYQKHFHVRLIEHFEGGAGFYFPDSAVQLGLIKTDSPQDPHFRDHHGQKNSSFNFVADDIAAVHADFTNEGIKVSPLSDFGGMKFFECTDPDGNILSIVEEVPGSPYHSDEIKKLQAK
ncbi:VOC family protein [Jeotgalibacillus terrae]|uniref:VOC family protein n=1 Tax=Jeotgalibacillus terrae TaxID=587735 RepID=A0ABW5ZI48_9BACL|nr:VOC family protein [Jeotgalibacillus terrae]MBM7579427.1 putative enzyme related to lactoylglutathione lyase [Jeotgalibacillus terrae]